MELGRYERDNRLGPRRRPVVIGWLLTLVLTLVIDFVMPKGFFHRDSDRSR